MHESCRLQGVRHGLGTHHPFGDRAKLRVELLRQRVLVNCPISCRICPIHHQDSSTFSPRVGAGQEPRLIKV